MPTAAAKLDPLPPPPLSLRALLVASWRSWWTSSLAKPGPYWLQLVWTAAFNAAIAVLLTVMGMAGGSDVPLQRMFLLNLWFANCIGFTIHALFFVGGRLLGQARLDAMSWWTRVVYFTSVPVAGVFIGYGIGFAGRGRNYLDILRENPASIFSVLLFSLVVSAIAYQFFRQQARLAEAEAAAQRERARLLDAEKQALDAQLRSLQAQIEPHFLFNTLANVVSLIDVAPAQARLMLERLIDLLRGSLAASRTLRTELGSEVALVTAYLDILAIRMGPRLRRTIDIDADVRHAALPPLLIQPLVENAIKHGLEPKVAGGTVQVRGQRAGDRLRIVVEDDGVGIGVAGHTGTGLGNLRDRLAALYGPRALLRVEALSPGTRITVDLPLAA